MAILNRKVLSLPFIVLVAASVLPGRIAALPEDSALLARLEKGEIIVTRLADENPRMLSGRVQGVIEAPLDRVWSVINDYNAYTSFMPHHLVSWIIKPEALDEIAGDPDLSRKHVEAKFAPFRLDSPEGDTAWVYAVLAMPFPLSNIWYVLKMAADPGTGLLSWDMATGSIAATSGSWQLEELDGRTLATYTTGSDLGYSVPGFLVSMAMNQDLPNAIKAIRRQAQ